VRVLHVINNLALAGAEVLVADLVPRLRDLGIDVSVAVLQRCPTRLEAVVSAIPGTLLHTGLANPRSPLQIVRLAKLFQGFDIVHSHIFPSQLWVAAARKLSPADVKLVTTEHNPDNNRRGKRLWYWPDRWMYAQYDIIVCNSQATEDAVIGEAPDSSGRTKVIPNGVDFGRFASLRRTRHSGPLTAIFVARLEPQKDHRTLLSALNRLPALRLQLIGDGSLRRELESLVNESGLRDRVEFLGWRDDIPELLNAADIYVHATHSDGFAISMVEAMAAGLPVVASNVPGLSGVLGDAGLLCKPEDPAELAAQLSRLMNDAALRDELSRRARNRAQQFSIDATVASHAELYQSLVGSSSRIGAGSAS
jgi:glycosyltransferase involved in cell wall biosynthesis